MVRHRMLMVYQSSAKKIATIFTFFFARRDVMWVRLYPIKYCCWWNDVVLFMYDTHFY
jgi:hypothetical protein